MGNYKSDAACEMSRRRPWMAAWLMLGLSSAAAPAPVQVVSLWPQGAPGAQHPATAETSRVTEQGERVVSNVHSPSITVYLPTAGRGVSGSTGVTGVVIIPGGGHVEWLAVRGF